MSSPPFELLGGAARDLNVRFGRSAASETERRFAPVAFGRLSARRWPTGGPSAPIVPPRTKLRPHSFAIPLRAITSQSLWLAPGLEGLGHSAEAKGRCLPPSARTRSGASPIELSVCGEAVAGNPRARAPQNPAASGMFCLCVDTHQARRCGAKTQRRAALLAVCRPSPGGPDVTLGCARIGVCGPELTDLGKAPSPCCHACAAHSLAAGARPRGGPALRSSRRVAR
jgi:hypothetical protein